MSFRNSKRRRAGKRVAGLRRDGKAINEIASLDPAVAVRLLMRSFMYPNPSEPTEKARAVLAEAEGFRMPFGKTSLQGYRWASDGSGPTVSFHHDWEHESGHWSEYVAPLLDKGCTVVAFDAPASGDSGGKRLGMRDYINAIHALRNRLERWDCAVGHGLGAAALVQALAQQPADRRPQRVVTLGVNANSRNIFQRRLASLGVEELVRLKFWRQLGKLREAPLSDYDNVLAVSRLAGVQGLMLHDSTDARYPTAEAEAVHAAWEGSNLVTLEGFGHELAGTAVMTRVVPFVGAHTAMEAT